MGAGHRCGRTGVVELAVVVAVVVGCCCGVVYEVLSSHDSYRVWRTLKYLCRTSNLTNHKN